MACAKMSQDSYAGKPEIAGFKQLIKYQKDDFWGFKANVYEKDKTIVIAFAGTDKTSVCDIYNNLQMTLGSIPNHYDKSVQLNGCITPEKSFGEKSEEFLSDSWEVIKIIGGKGWIWE